MSHRTIPVFQTWADVQDYLADTTDYERMLQYRMQRGEFDLGRVERFFDALGVPQASFASVHIAGSVGKGSTAHLVDALLRAQGKRVGLYTSPHLERVTERIRIAGAEIDEASLVAVFRDMAPVLARFQDSGDRLTWFEIMTGAALVAFRAAGVEVAVLETGLGGRLDATNAVWPALSIITLIEHEHHDKLGETLADIAREKAGIIKSGVPVLTGAYAREALEVVLARAREQESPLRRYGHDFEARNIQFVYGGIAFELRGTGYRFTDLRMPVLLPVQATNAALAVEALALLAQLGVAQPLQEREVQAALAAFHIAGRCEMVGDRPRVIIDVAHTEESIARAVKLVRQHFPDGHCSLVFAIAQDKEHERIVPLLASTFRHVVLTEFPGVRATPVARLDALWRKYGGVAPILERDPLRALALASAWAEEDGGVFVTGSFYLAGEIRKHITEQRP